MTIMLWCAEEVTITEEGGAPRTTGGGTGTLLGIDREIRGSAVVVRLTGDIDVITSDDLYAAMAAVLTEATARIRSCWIDRCALSRFSWACRAGLCPSAGCRATHPVTGGHLWRCAATP